MDVENSNGDGIYKCDVCNFESKYSQNLQIHFKSLKHMTNIDAWTLEFTNNETNGFEEPQSNTRKSIGDRVYKCDPCKFETKYSQNLEAHFKSLKHIANTDNPENHTTIVHEENEFIDPNGHAEEESYENEGNFDFRFCIQVTFT